MTFLLLKKILILMLVLLHKKLFEQQSEVFLVMHIFYLKLIQKIGQDKHLFLALYTQKLKIFL